MRFLTAGESHGQALVGILEGLPAGLAVSPADIDRDLERRQMGYGRGGRMQIERDHVDILSGVRFGETLGSPVALMVKNRDWEHWQERMSVTGPPAGPAVTKPRPGHADLAGALKYDRRDARDILERASARETTMRVALGAIARKLLDAFGITVLSHVVALGGVIAEGTDLTPEMGGMIDASPVRTADPRAERLMMEAIDRARERGDTLGGVFEVAAFGLPVGLGSHVHYDRRLDGRLGQAMLSIPAMKGVEVGDAFWASGEAGSGVHDAIDFEAGKGFHRPTNRAGGLEGGMTNGEVLTVRVAMKPLSTLKSPLPSADLATGERVEAQVERSDVTAVPAAGVIGEAMAALVLADALLDKFGHDALSDVKGAYEAYLGRLPR